MRTVFEVLLYDFHRLRVLESEKFPTYSCFLFCHKIEEMCFKDFIEWQPKLNQALAAFTITWSLSKRANFNNFAFCGNKTNHFEHVISQKQYWLNFISNYLRPNLKLTCFYFLICGTRNFKTSNRLLSSQLVSRGTFLKLVINLAFPQFVNYILYSWEIGIFKHIWTKIVWFY